jgi:hypothetical protein
MRLTQFNNYSGMVFRSAGAGLSPDSAGAFFRIVRICRRRSLSSSKRILPTCYFQGEEIEGQVSTELKEEQQKKKSNSTARRRRRK